LLDLEVKHYGKQAKLRNDFMKDFFDCVITTNGMAYGTGVLIFVITLFLVANRVIGFMLTLLLLGLALGASWGVANQDFVRSYITSFFNSSTTAQAPRKSPEENSIDTSMSDNLQNTLV
jgi:hypothetical protein